LNGLTKLYIHKKIRMDVEEIIDEIAKKPTGYSLIHII